MLLATACAWGSALAASPCTTPLRLGYDEAALPPQLNGAGPDVDASAPGWNVLVAREAARRTGCPYTELRAPARRLLAMLEFGQLDFAYFFAATPERLRTLQYPVDDMGLPDPAFAPVSGRMEFVTLRGQADALGWNGRDVRRGARIGVMAGSVQAQVAISRGWTVELITTPGSALPMLRGRRFDALLTVHEALPPDMLGPGSVFEELQPAIQQLYFYAPTSRETFATRPDVVWRYWHALCVASRPYADGPMPVCGTHRG